MPVISVIVPVYKVEEYLNRCVDSILSQTFTDFELFLVDDSSPDRCGAICDEYARKDNRVRVIHQQNGGPSAARNAALDIVLSEKRSEWISFIDSDDWVHPYYLEVLLRTAVEQDVKFSLCGFVRTEEETSFLPEKPTEPLPTYIVDAKDYFFSDLDKDRVLPPNEPFTKLFAASLFENIRFPVGRIAEGMTIMYKLVFLAEKVAVVDFPMVYYFQRAGSFMHEEWNEKRMDFLKAASERIAFFENRPGCEELCKKFKKSYCYQLSYHIERAGKYPELQARMRKELKKTVHQIKRYLLKGDYSSFVAYSWELRLRYDLSLVKKKLKENRR